VEGKAVLLGPDTEYDRHATPYYTAFGGDKAASPGIEQPVRWNTAGIEIHASTLNTLLTRDFLSPAPDWMSVSSLFSAAAGTVLLAQRVRPILFAGLLPFLVAALLLLTNFAFRNGYVLPVMPLLTAALLATLLATIERYVWSENRRDLFRSAIDVFVGRKFSRSLEETGRVGRSGTQQFVTILLSDIRGFTSFCESRSPEEVVNLLNEYLAQMVKIIVAHKGSVNKFLGDGILVVFSDDDGTAAGDHASRALACSVEMVRAPSRFTTGIGIHTGPVVIGNVGSEEKLEYTVLGETVNVASRIEGLNKPLQTQILFSEDTLHRLADASTAYPLGEVPVRGLSAPLRLYTLTEVYPAAAGAGRG
jgi:adenylate cyclase